MAGSWDSETKFGKKRASHLNSSASNSFMPMKSAEMAPTVVSSSFFFQKNPLFAKVMTGMSQLNKSAEMSQTHKLCRLIEPVSEKKRQV